MVWAEVVCGVIVAFLRHPKYIVLGYVWTVLRLVAYIWANLLYFWKYEP